eukprot:gnl/MRDRNA2_/MRDRNA2_30793_c0_seq1.p1 gnl/MRDRNA2_/MRDRNA2_30793_c0~~gnl/MRDRNA2_/MRDRNA2_30793_c0_seq1.p1  ORF type:complete len:561 (+),score=73.78 gnl/MRDRNA2_/MRDRNA2_30793_c0_seq1:70-1752(+)
MSLPVPLFSSNALLSGILFATDATDLPDSAAKDIPLWQVAASFTVIVLESVVAKVLQLGVANEMLTAGIRCWLQLTILGLILRPIIEMSNPYITFGYIFCFMVFISAYETSARPKVTHPRMYMDALCSIFGALLLNGAVLLLVVAPDPWYSPQYVIPLAGMLINNSLTSLTVALNSILDQISSKKEHIEVLLAFGATPFEATWPLITVAVRQAFVPQINGMNVVGLVSIPGMMTGQVLGGSSPQKAARYQIVIFFLISGTVTSAVGLICALTVRSLFDKDGRMAAKKITKQSRKKIAELLNPSACWRCCSRLFCCCQRFRASAPLLSAPSNVDVCRVVTLNHRTASKHLLEGGDELLQINMQGASIGSVSLWADFSVRAGEVACLMGPSGIGKSTLLKLVANLEESNASSAALRGEQRSALKPQLWRREVLYLQQMVVALPGTPQDFIQDVSKFKVNNGRPTMNPVPLLCKFGLSDEFLDRPWSEVSGGERQRIMLAIAIATQPACILLDEPTSALDGASKLLVEDELQNLNCAVLLVTHDEQQAKRMGHSMWHFDEQGM